MARARCSGTPPPRSRAGFYRSERRDGSTGLVAGQPRAGVGARHQFLTLIVLHRDAGAHRRPLRRHPQGLLPAAGHRPHPGRLRGAAGTCRSRRWPEAARTLAPTMLEDPAVESVSSFIGVDGTNITPNTGRLLIALKPHGAPRRRGEMIERLKQRARATGRHPALHAAGAGPHHRGPRRAARSTSAR